MGMGDGRLCAVLAGWPLICLLDSCADALNAKTPQPKPTQQQQQQRQGKEQDFRGLDEPVALVHHARPPHSSSNFTHL
ncbi:hypothetical protein BKA80DRAFT_282069, partial [Phyllosticta citrichinensis]